MNEWLTMALLKKRGYNEKWNNDDDVNHQSVTELQLTLQLIYICTVAAPLSVQILCRVDHCMQRPAPGRLTTLAVSSSALRLITALWPHVLPSRNNYSRDASPSAIDIVHLPRVLPQTLGGVVWTLRTSEPSTNQFPHLLSISEVDKEVWELCLSGPRGGTLRGISGTARFLPAQSPLRPAVTIAFLLGCAFLFAVASAFDSCFRFMST